MESVGKIHYNKYRKQKVSDDGTKDADPLHLPKGCDRMKRNKLFVAAILVLILVAGALCLNVAVQRKFIRTYTYTELEYRGYTARDVREITIHHSYFNRLLSYNEWRISVEFEEEPGVLFWFTYRDQKILFQGVSADPMPDKEAILDYSERFKKGTLLDK